MNDYVVVYEVDGQLKAESICLLLKSFAINATHSQESAGIAYGLTIGPMGNVKILVPAAQETAAKEILDALEKGDLEQDEPPEDEPDDLD